MNKAQKNNALIIFGTKNMAIEIKEMATFFYPKHFDSISMVYFSDNFIEENRLENKINRDNFTLFFIIGFGGTNRRLCIESVKKYPNFVPFSIIHPSAVIAKSAKIGKGCLIFPNTTISSNAVIGDHCVVNYNASIGHDSLLSDNIFIQPGARVSGNCCIGNDTLIGSNTFIYQNVKVGKECLIDALTYIHNDVPDGIIVSSRYPEPKRRDDLPKSKIPMWE